MTWGEVLHTYGLATLIVLFLLAGTWFGSTYFTHLLLGNHKTGQIGILQQSGTKVVGWIFRAWRQMDNSMAEQTTLGEVARIRGDASAAQSSESARNLRILVESETPPEGEASIARSLIAKTAVTADQLQFAMLEHTKAWRLIGSQFPDIAEAMNTHCDNIESEVRKSTEELLREQEKAKTKVEKPV